MDGSPLRDDVLGLVERVIVDSSVHLADMIELSFRDGARDALGRAGIRIGSAVTVSTTRAGDGTQTPLVQAEITALECEFDELGTRAVARGYDHAHRLTRGRRTHSYNDVTDADIVGTVARRAGLSVGEVASGGPVHEHVAQLNCTDWEFLLARSRETGHEVAVLDGAVHWRKPATSADAPMPAPDLVARESRQLVLGTNLLRFRPRVTAAAQVERGGGARLGPAAQGGRGRPVCGQHDQRRGGVGAGRAGGHLRRPAARRPSTVHSRLRRRRTRPRPRSPRPSRARTPRPRASRTATPSWCPARRSRSAVPARRSTAPTRSPRPGT